MEWIKVRLSAQKPERIHTVMVRADRAEIERKFSDGLSKPTVTIKIGAILLPLRHAQNVDGDTELFAAHLAPGSTLSLGRNGSPVRWNGELICEAPAPFSVDLRLRPPLMSEGAPGVSLNIEFKESLLNDQGEVIYDKAAIRAILPNGELSSFLFLKNHSLTYIFSQEEIEIGEAGMTPWHLPPAILQRGFLRADVPAQEFWERTVWFEKRGKAWAFAMGVYATRARSAGTWVDAVVMGPFGILAHDGVKSVPGSRPRDLMTTVSIPSIQQKGDEVWTVRQTCRVSAAFRPRNHEARPTWRWNQSVRELHESLSRVNGSDPSSMAFTFDDVAEHWSVLYRTNWDPDTSTWVGEVDDVHLEAPIPVNAKFSRFFTHEGSHLSMALRITGSSVNWDKKELAWKVSIVLADDQAPATLEQGTKARIGALDLRFGLRASAEETSKVELWFKNDYKGACVKALGVLRLGLSGFAPASQDPAAGDSEAQGQLILRPDRALINGSFVLQATESVSADTSHALSFGLFRGKDAPVPPPFPLVVLDMEPFLIARVDVNLGDNREIGNRSPGQAWELADVSTEGQAIARITLPSQVIGEETVKKYEDPFEPTPGALIAHHFSPAGLLQIRRSAFLQRYTEAPWNVRRLFGHDQQEFPGSPFVLATTELLYGLSLTIRGGKLTRISEVLHRAGPILAFGANAPWRSRVETERTETEKATEAAMRLVRGRVALLTPYEIGGERAWSTRNVTALFRPSRRAADPIAPKSPGPGYLPVREDPPQGNRWGVRGGADWGFESSNILQEALHSSASSSSAAVFDLSLSALGSGGAVKAGFARDKTTIFAEAFLGRTFFTSIERVGRIGVLWNVAKHIITYERATKGSEQFTDESGQRPTGEREHFPRRPVLRKVREVVQVTETLRPFPDASSEAKATSFVRGTRFQEEPIEVKSEWGRDVPDGWEIPLCRVDSTDKPRAFLELASVDGEKAATISARITNPEDLYFFSSTRPEDGANTEAWPPFAGVDFPLTDIPVRDATGSQEALPVGRTKLPDAPTSVGGMDRFTFRVDASGLRTNLGASRSSRPIGTTLENVTLGRRGARNLDPEDKRLTPEVKTTLEKSVKLEGALGTIDDERAKLFVSFPPQRPELDKFLAAAKEQAKTVHDLVDPTQALAGWQANASLPDLSLWLDRTASHLLSDAHVAGDAERVELLKQLIKDALARLRGVENVAGALVERWQTLARLIDDLTARLDARLEAICQKLLSRVDDNEEAWEALVRASISDLVLFGSQARSSLGTQFGGALASWSSGLERALNDGLALTTPAQRTLEKINALLAQVRSSFEAAARLLAQARVEASTLETAFKNELATWDGQIDAFAKTLADQTKQDVEGARKQLQSWVKTRKGELRGWRDQAARSLKEAVQIKDIWGFVLADGELDAMGRLVAQLGEQVPGEELRLVVKEALRLPFRALESRKDVLTTEVESLRRVLKDALKDAPEADEKLLDALRAFDSVGERGLRVLRAFGEVPRVPGLEFTRDRVAYYFLQGSGQALAALDGVHFTPMSALVGGAEKELKALGVQWPTGGFAEALLPDYRSLASRLLRDIFPDFAGLNLSELLQDVLFPPEAIDGVKLRHHFEPSTRQASVELAIKVEKAEAKLFEIGPICLTLRRVRFEAFAQVEVAVSGASRQRVNGTIVADWVLRFGAIDVVSLRDTQTEFDDGRLSFKVDPSKIELPAAVRFLAKILEQAKQAKPDDGSGLSIEFIHENGGTIPVGMRALLGLALPTLGAPPLSISNLALRSYLEIAMLGGRFSIGAGLSLSSRERPFQLAIVILSGGGWLDAGVRYPLGGQIVPRLSIGIAAGASLQFNIGVASGGVSLLLDVGVDWNGDVPLSIILGLTLRGELQVLGLISISVSIRLEGEYRTDGSLYARGRLRVKIKICWFIKINVNVGFEVVLAGNSNKSLFALAQGEDPIERYLSTFGGTL